nr:nitroreductase family protein [uncultured Carboxylicivirga sp.]
MISIPHNCTDCKLCEKICPTLSIDIDKKTINNNCIECYQCLAVCPVRDEHTDAEILGPTIKNAVQPFDFETLLQQRRSVRIFKDQKIKKDTLIEFVNHMKFSPSASNTRALEFTIIEDKNTLKAVNDLTISALTKTFKHGVNWFTKPLIKAFMGSTIYNEMYASKTKFMRKAAFDPNMICYNAPALILVHAKKTPTNMPESDANIWLGMAMLYAQTLDLATCTNGYIINAAKRNKELRQRVNIPDHHSIFGALLIGYPQTKYINRVDRPEPQVQFI